MDRIISALEKTLTEIDNLDRGIQGDSIENSSILATKVNSYVHSLAELSNSGRTMDTAALFPVPVELFDVIDEENGDPNDFLDHITRSCESNAHEVSRAIFYLQELRSQVDKSLAKGESEEQQTSASTSTSKRKLNS